jgi:hypothetical protein
MRVFLDESGFTGEDLLNEAQPVFVLASTVLSEEESRRIHGNFFADVRARELKHSTLAKTAKGRSRVLRFLRAVRALEGQCATYVVHKEFCLLSKLVDWWVESGMHEKGFDFYRDGANLAFTNVCFFCLRTFESPGFLRETLRLFQKMMRYRTKGAYVEFWSGLRRKMKRCRKETRQILEYFDLSERILGPRHFLGLPDKALDISVTTAVESIAHWRNTTDEDLEVIHDNSSVMAREKWIWDAVVAQNVPHAAFRRGDRVVKYPLNVANTILGDSANFAQLQFCDILAGATATWARSLTIGPRAKACTSQYAQELEGAGIRDFLIGGIWPTPDVDPMVTEGPTDHVEFIGRIINRSARRGS